MQSRSIHPVNNPVKAKVRVPGSKSITNRALLIAALANGKTTLQNALFSDDSRYFSGALMDLGFTLEMDEDAGSISIWGTGGTIPKKEASLFIGNAGTAARFLSAFLCIGDGQYTLDGEPRMRERPIGDLLDSLAALGVKLSGTKNPETGQICPPVRIVANGLAGGVTRITGQTSSQYVSALMMIAPYAKAPFKIEVAGELNSKPYVDMTEKVMADFGLRIGREGYRIFSVEPGRYISNSNYMIESDASAASYFFALPAVTGGSVTVENISRASIQGDINFLDVLASMGLHIEVGQNEITVHNHGVTLKGVDIDMSQIPDTAQTLAAIAPFACSPTTIRGIASARVKETDRVTATCIELRKLGVQVQEFPDGMRIEPCDSIVPAKIETYKDHRMAMAFSLIGLRQAGVEILDPGCVSKTFPNFIKVLESVK